VGAAHEEDFVNALGAMSGNQAMQHGPRRTEGDLSLRLAGRGRRQHRFGAMYPDQSLYPANAAPELAKRINRTLQRADQIEASEGGPRSTGSRRSSPMPRPASAARSTASRS
jgi:isocitrate lyase